MDNYFRGDCIISIFIGKEEFKNINYNVYYRGSICLFLIIIFNLEFFGNFLFFDFYKGR